MKALSVEHCRCPVEKGLVAITNLLLILCPSQTVKSLKAEPEAYLT